jgi:hypothetical protein
MCDRYVRAVEAAVKFFRSYELYLYAEAFETLRDLLNRMDKAALIESVPAWIEMRDLRNRVVHDYLPEQLREIYDLITGRLGQELVRLSQSALLSNPKSGSLDAVGATVPLDTAQDMLLYIGTERFSSRLIGAGTKTRSPWMHRRRT